MALVISDRIKEITNTVGTQTYQLEGAVTGFETFAANLSDGDTTYYAVTDNTNFEVGLGTINEGTSQTINYTVTVANVGGINVFVLNGVNNPVITFVKGFTYVFDVSDNTNGSHPLRFRTSADASYTDGVSISGTQGQAGSTVTIVVASDAPSTLKYYCTSHGNAMGNTINVISAVATLARTTILASSNSNNAVSFGSGAKTIFCTLPAGKAVIKDASNNINGTFVGNITGNVTGNASGTAATVTGAAQTNITSVGTLTGLTINGDATLTKSSGDTKLFLEADSDNDTEGDNAFIIFKQDGGVETSAVWTGNFGGSNDNALNLTNSGAFGGGIRFGTTATNGGWETATERMRIDRIGDITIFGTNGDIKFDYSADTLTFEDNIKAVFGTGGDLEIYHDGSNSIIEDIGTGGLRLKTGNAGRIQFENAEGDTLAKFDGNGNNELYHNNVKKIETTSDGATVTGDLTTTADIELGHASDTTIARASAGVVTIEGNTVLTTGNSDAPSTTTSSSDADFVLIDDGGTMKKITPSNLGITAGAASLDDATALAIALG